MKVLVVGGGGREHALAWKISKSPKVTKVFVAPGNAGMTGELETVDIKVSDIEGLINFAREKEIDLTVVGPEGPLTEGIVDRFDKAGLRAFGPSAAAAEVEGSKVFARELLSRLKVPQPGYAVFTDHAGAKDYIKNEVKSFPLVIKADGLAAGKGVIIAMDEAEALAAVDLIMIERAFGAAGERVLIEEFMEGKEVSFFVITDGERIIPLPTAQDYKRISDGDRGPNTGGMGCYSPSAFLTDEEAGEIMERIVKPTLAGMKKEGRRYKGFLYTGLMITSDGPKVLEFNCRMGDPETQVIIPRIESDIVPYLEAAADERLDTMSEMKISDYAAVTVIMASHGYPGKADTGYVIEGIENAEEMDGVEIFFAGVALKDSRIVNSGGRVLAVTASGGTISQARERAYKATKKISFKGAYYRRDIAADAC